jgi:hypothetical protein
MICNGQMIRKGKAVEKQRRKATGLKRNAMIAELPINMRRLEAIGPQRRRFFCE